jgi:hypothetical protein
MDQRSSSKHPPARRKVSALRLLQGHYLAKEWGDSDQFRCISSQSPYDLKSHIRVPPSMPRMDLSARSSDDIPTAGLTA